MLVVAETAAGVLLEHGIQCLLAGVPERRMPEVVTKADRLRQVLVETQRAGDRTRNAAGLQRVSEARSVVVADRGDEDLGLVLEAPKALGVDDAVAVTLKRRPQATRFLLDLTPSGIGRRRASGQRFRFQGPNPALESRRYGILGGVLSEVCRVRFHMAILARRTDKGTAAMRFLYPNERSLPLDDLAA